MSVNNRIPVSTSRLSNLLLSHPPRSSALRTRSTAQPTAIYTNSGARGYSLFKGWKGSDPDAHSIRRAKEGDTEDPQSEATASGMEEREQNEGIADQTQSQGMTERGGRKQAEKAKKEHPKAPEPIIGMNDERAQVRAHT